MGDGGRSGLGLLVPYLSPHETVGKLSECHGTKLGDSSEFRHGVLPDVCSKKDARGKSVLWLEPLVIRTGEKVPSPIYGR